MDATTRLKLEELRKEAFKRLETDTHKRNGEEVKVISEWCLSASVKAASDPELRVHFSGILRQICQDLRATPIYSCLAMWLDPEHGLAHYAPGLLLDIGERLLQLKVGVIHED